MFISFSKTIARFCGFKLGFGMRLNKRNALWMSFIVVFVLIFQLMWYMIVFCGWIFYAMCYGVYRCINKLFFALLRKNKQRNKPKMSNKSNNALEQKDNEIKSNPQIARWIIGCCIVMFALVNGLHYSSLFLLGSALLMLPLSFIKRFMQKLKINTLITIIISVILFILAAITSTPT